MKSDVVISGFLAIIAMIVVVYMAVTVPFPAL